MNELDGCMEEINEHGLAVVLLLADVVGANAPVDEGPQVGVNSVQLPRFVLDTCATAEQAARVLRETPQYDGGMPLHYLIADASGHAFVRERDRDGTGHVVEAGGTSLCVTNHPVHRRPDPAAPPRDDDETMLTYGRPETLTARARSAPLSASRLRETLDEVRFDARNAGRYPVRTLWRTVFDLDDRVMWSRFYLGDRPDGSPATTRRSPSGSSPGDLRPTGAAHRGVTGCSVPGPGPGAACVTSSAGGTDQIGDQAGGVSRTGRT